MRDRRPVAAGTRDDEHGGGEPDREPPALGGASLGVGAIALGGLGSVVAVRHIDEALGLSDLVGGLFVVGLLCALPEGFAAWSPGRKRQVTTALSNAVADGISSLTLALVPQAFARAPVGQVGLYALNLGCVGLQLAALVLILWRRGKQDSPPFEGAHVVLPLVVIYAVDFGVALETWL